MSNRFQDWLNQAKRDLQFAQVSGGLGYFEWTCFVAQQSAEKAIKALLLFLGRDAWGHSIFQLLRSLSDLYDVNDLIDAGKILDKYYIPTRYPNGFDMGSPADYFTQKEASDAIAYSEQIIRFCEDILLRSRSSNQ